MKNLSSSFLCVFYIFVQTIFKAWLQITLTAILQFMTIQISSISDLPTLAKNIISFAANDTIWLLEGEMGAGKTTLSKAICKELGVIDTVSSPTFSIVNQYLTSEDATVYHFDFYRLRHESEAFAIGIEEYFYSNNICLIEWSSKIPNLLPENYITIQITKDQFEQNEHRTVVLMRKS